MDEPSHWEKQKKHSLSLKTYMYMYAKVTRIIQCGSCLISLQVRMQSFWALTLNYSQTICSFDGNLANFHCNIGIWLTVGVEQVAAFNSNLLEQVGKLRFSFCLIKWGKPSSVSINKMTLPNIRCQSTDWEISDSLSSNCQTVNFT